MKNSIRTEFNAVILRHQGMDAGYIEFPGKAEEIFGTRGRVKVKALFDGTVEYRGSLANMGTGCHILGLTKEVRNQLGKSFGDMVSVEIEPDTEECVVEIPPDVMKLLGDNPEAAAFFSGLSFTNRKEYIRWIETAKKEETRRNRLEALISRLKDHRKFSGK